MSTRRIRVILLWISGVSGFLAPRAQKVVQREQSAQQTCLFETKKSKEQILWDLDDPEPYRNRSQAWTKTYRSLIPYEKARRVVLEMGFRSKEDWDEYVANGKEFHGPYLPNHPDEMYAEEWRSWEEFLGIMRDYEDAKNMVQNILMITTRQQYRDFIQDSPKRAEMLRIPAKPEIVYKNKGWVDDYSFFGVMQ